MSSSYDEFRRAENYFYAIATNYNIDGVMLEGDEAWQAFNGAIAAARYLTTLEVEDLKSLEKKGKIYPAFRHGSLSTVGVTNKCVSLGKQYLDKDICEQMWRVCRSARELYVYDLTNVAFEGDLSPQ